MPPVSEKSAVHPSAHTSARTNAPTSARTTARTAARTPARTPVRAPAHPPAARTVPAQRTRRKRHPHDDAPDTDADFRRLAGMEPGPERDALRQELVCAWMPMAARLARQFRGRGESLEDLEQVAHLGLVKAVMRYDPAYGTAFASYAVPTILGEVKRHFRDHMWGLHVPRRVQELRNRVRTATHELSHSLDGRRPDVTQLAAHANMTPDEVRAGLEAMDSYAMLSLDAAMADADDGYSLADTLGNKETGYDRVVERESVRSGLAELPEREKRILYLRFFRGMTQRRIAEQLGISQMHVSRLLSRTCAQLRERAETGARTGGAA